MTLAQLRGMAPSGYLARPQRPDFHLLVIGTGGSDVHRLDFSDFPIRPGAGVWVRPGQVQRFGPGKGCDANLVLFRPDFVFSESYVGRVASDPFGRPAFDATASAGVLEQRCRLLWEEYARVVGSSESVSLAHVDGLRHALSLLLLAIIDTGTVGRTPMAEAPPLYDLFRRRLEQDFSSAHDVAHYAAALGYSSRTLTRATLAGAGQPPKVVIDERVALEAARLLAHSDQSISAVARGLGFHDASNFSKFFTRQMGMTPSVFRRAQPPG